MLIKYEFSGFEKCDCYAFASTSFKKNVFFLFTKKGKRIQLPGEDISAFLTLTYFLTSLTTV